MNEACPSEARLIEFTLTPLQEENVDIAVHILHCRDCAKKLYLMNQVILSHCEVTPEDWAEIKSFRPRRNPAVNDRNPAVNDLWQKVERLLNYIIPADFEFIHAYEEQPLVAASSGKEPPHDSRRVRREDREASPSINLVFKADCEDDDPHFWTASLQLDLTVGSDDLQPISVTDCSGNPIIHGVLLLCGQTLLVSAGKAYISLGDFRRNLRNREVAFQFAAGKRVAGSLALALEGV